MANKLTEDALRYIVQRVLDNANDAVRERETDNSDFLKGRLLAYYEVLDTIKNELEIEEQDLKEYGLDFTLETILK